jgi:serine/threonine-protein kinase
MADALRRSGLLLPEAVDAALGVQRGLRELGESIPLVAIALRRRLVTVPQANHILRETGDRIAYCEVCQRVRFLDADEAYDPEAPCVDCGALPPRAGRATRPRAAPATPPPPAVEPAPAVAGTGGAAPAADTAPAEAPDDLGADDLVGSQLAGFTVRERVKDGIYRGWYRADRRGQGTVVMLLRVPARILRSSRRMMQLREDFYKVKLVTHRAAPTRFELAPFENTFYILQEPLQGVLLRQFVSKMGAVPLEKALKILVQVAEVGVAGHRQDLINFDFNPDLVVVDRHLGVKLRDVGTGYLVEDGLGEMQFRAPERLAGEQVDNSADVYSLCALAHYLLTGEPPFPGTDVAKVTENVLNGNFSPVSKRLPSLDFQMSKLIESGMSLAPMSRPQTLREVLDRLRTISRSLGRQIMDAQVQKEIEAAAQAAEGEEGTGKGRPPVGDTEEPDRGRATARTLRDRLRTGAVSPADVRDAVARAQTPGDLPPKGAGAGDPGMQEIADAKRRAREFIRLKRFRLALKALRRITAFEGKGPQYAGEVENARKVIAILEEKQR